MNKLKLSTLLVLIFISISCFSQDKPVTNYKYFDIGFLGNIGTNVKDLPGKMLRE